MDEVLPESSIVNCKWPNDVLVDKRKISGILLEAQAKPQGDMDWLIIGIGINIKSFPKNTEFPATSLFQEGAEEKNICTEVMLELFCRRFLVRYGLWKKTGFDPIRKAWLSRAAWLNEEITVHLEGKILRGEFKALDKDGALVLLRNGDKQRITTGDIFL